MNNIFILQSVHKNSIVLEPDKIILNDFEIDEPKLINFFHELKAANEYSDEQLHDKITSLLYFGYMADQAVKVGEKVDYVKEGFGSLKKDMENQIENNFSESMKKKIDTFLGEEGSFTQELRETFGTDGAHSQKINELIEDYRDKINSMLDLNDDSSPLKALEKSLDEKFVHILTFMNSREETKKVEDKSPQKGAKFEDFVSSILSESSTFFNCNFEKTGGIKGISGAKNSKKGDFVLTEKTSNKKIVLEAKNLSKDPTTKQILEYARIAIENRGADYCVYIYCDSDDTTIPEAGMFNELEKNILFLTVSETDTYFAKERMIRLGCSWALQRIRADDTSDAELNDKLTKMQGILRKNLDTIKTMKNNSSGITKACSNMISELEIDLGLKEEKED